MSNASFGDHAGNFSWIGGVRRRLRDIFPVRRPEDELRTEPVSDNADGMPADVQPPGTFSKEPHSTEHRRFSEEEFRKLAFSRWDEEHSAGTAAQGRGRMTPGGKVRKQRVDDDSNVTAALVEDIDFGYHRDFDELYTRMEVIGSGSFGVVRRCVEVATGREFAVKAIPKVKLKSKKYLMRMQSEVDVMRTIGPSLNVVAFLEAFESSTHVFLLMELCRGGELMERIRKRKYRLTERGAARIVRQMLLVVAQLHAHGIVYRDLKPGNFLFLDEREDSPLKATDFGLCATPEWSEHVDKLDARVGTPYYMAPEVIRRHYGPECDVWSLGIAAYQLIAGVCPFRTPPNEKDSVKVLFQSILSDDPDFAMRPWDQISPDGLDLIRRMLSKDAATRITVQEALLHPWFVSMRVVDEGYQSAVDDSRKSPPQERPSIRKWLHARAAMSAAASQSVRGRSAASSSDTPAATLKGVAEMAGFRSALYGTLVQRVQRWGTFGHLKQTALRSICKEILGCLSQVGNGDTEFGDGLVYGSSEMQRESTVLSCGLTWKAMLDLVEVEGAIRMIRTDIGRGYQADIAMTPADLDHSLKASGYVLLRDESEQLHRLLDVNRTGLVNSLDVAAALMDWKVVEQSPRWEEWCDDIFRAADANGSGAIEPQDVANFLPDESAYGVTASRVQSVFAKHDHNRDGVIDVHEWRHLLLTADTLDVYDSRYNAVQRGQRHGEGGHTRGPAGPSSSSSSTSSSSLALSSSGESSSGSDSMPSL